MALTTEELRYLLTLDPKQFTGSLQSVKAQVEQTRRQAEKPVTFRANMKGVIDQVGKLGLAVRGIQDIYNIFASTIKRTNDEFLKQETSLRKVEAAAKLTGTSLETLQGISKTLQDDFKLTESVANDFTVAVNNLVTAAGQTERAEEVLRNLFDLAAGQGLTASEALLRFQQATKGIDEGTEALFSGRNPVDLYKSFAEQIGTTAGKMDDMQKKQAIVNQIVQDGGKLQGEYNNFLKTAAGIQSQNADRMNELRANIGELLNEGLIPLIRIVSPVVDGLNSMDAGSRNAAIGVLAFVAVTGKVRTGILGMRTALIALNASMGPAGWLILGIGAAATALGIYAASAEDAEAANIDLEKSNVGVADSFGGIVSAVKRLAAKREIEELIKLQDFYVKRVKDARETLDALYERQAAGEDVTRNEIAKSEESYKRAQVALEAFTKEIERRRNLQKEVESGLTAKQIEELDKRREYEFESNRISLGEYIDYLESRRAAVKEKLGVESVEYEKFVDKIGELQKQLAGEQAKEIDIPFKLDIRTDTDTQVLSLDNLFQLDSEGQVDVAREMFGELYNIQLQFQELTFAALESEYNARKGYVDLNVENARNGYGEESEAYKDAVFQRLVLERNFQTEKRRLMLAGARATIDVTSQLLSASQGLSRSLFEWGKAASIAQAVINTYEAATKALTAGPIVGPALMASIITLGLAQVAKIAAVEFIPPEKPEVKKFAKGSNRPLSAADVIQSVFTPPGESGLVAVQTGEFIVNRKATREFSDVLRAMNAGQFQRPSIQRFQTGGPVGVATPPPPSAAPPVTVTDLREIVDAMREVKIVIKAELDAMRFYKETFSKFEDNRNERRIT